jgi:hypothetical protein
MPLITSTTATTSSVADDSISQTLLASNSSRKGMSVYNDSTVALYIAFGATASLTSFNTVVRPGGYYEIFGRGVYTGAISGIWSSNASGSARITEW